MNRHEAEQHCIRLEEIRMLFLQQNYPGYIDVPWVGIRKLTKSVKRKTGGNSVLAGRKARALKRHTLPRIGECGRRSER